MTEKDDDVARRLIEASAWRVHLTEIGVESTAEFEIWIGSDQRNLEAWRRVEVPWDFLGEHATEREIVAARSAALGLPHFGRPPIARPPPWRLIVVTPILVVAALAAAVFWWLQPTSYQTALGERRVLTLVDGTRVTLDANSELDVSYSTGSRNLQLLRGQARFEVAHDSARPFFVAAYGAVVRAVGTDFDVDLPGQSLVVTLLEGRVTISDATHLTALRSGQQLTLAIGQAPVVGEADSSDVVAWQNGQVVFHNVPLSAVVERLNRYDRARFVLADQSLATRRVSGTFNTGNAAAIAEILTRYLEIKAIYSNSGQIELRR
jgi:transmembrane sensor